MPLQVRSLERDEISVVGEWGGEADATALVLSIDHPMMDCTDAVLLSGSLRYL